MAHSLIQRPYDYSVRLSGDMYLDLIAASIDQECPRSSVVRRALKEYLKVNPPTEDAVTEAVRILEQGGEDEPVIRLPE